MLQYVQDESSRRDLRVSPIISPHLPIISHHLPASPHHLNASARISPYLPAPAPQDGRVGAAGGGDATIDLPIISPSSPRHLPLICPRLPVVPPCISSYLPVSPRRRRCGRRAAISRRTQLSGPRGRGGARSRCRDHPRSPEITRDHPRSPEIRCRRTSRTSTGTSSSASSSGAPHS